MRQAVLHRHGTLGGIFAVGGVIVAAQNSFEILAQHPNQDLGAARRVDGQEDKTGGPETPGPVTLAIVFVPGLIGVETGLLGQPFDQLFIGPGEGLAGFVEKSSHISPPRL